MSLEAITYHRICPGEDLSRLNDGGVPPGVDQLQHAAVRRSEKDDVELHPADGFHGGEDGYLGEIRPICPLDEQRRAEGFNSPVEERIPRGEGDRSLRELGRIRYTAAWPRLGDLISRVGLPNRAGTPLMLEGAVVEFFADFLHREGADGAHPEDSIRGGEDRIDYVVTS